MKKEMSASNPLDFERDTHRERQGEKGRERKTGRERQGERERERETKTEGAGEGVRAERVCAKEVI